MQKYPKLLQSHRAERIAPLMHNSDDFLKFSLHESDTRVRGNESRGESLEIGAYD